MPLHQKNTRDDDMRLNIYRLLISENKVAYMIRRINKSSSFGWQELKENQKCMPLQRSIYGIFQVKYVCAYSKVDCKYCYGSH